MESTLVGGDCLVVMHSRSTGEKRWAEEEEKSSPKVCILLEKYLSRGNVWV